MDAPQPLDPLAIFFDFGDTLADEATDPRIFEQALRQLGIAPEEYGRVIMVGNHLERDVKGANRLGLISVWLDWAPRRAKEPAGEWEVPRYTIKEPLQLLALLTPLSGSG